MFDWREVLKNQKTFQSLGIGEIDLDSAVEEDERCIPKLMKVIKRIEQNHEKILSDTALYKKKDKFASGSIQVHFSTEEFEEVNPYLSASHIYVNPDIEKLLTEDFACDVIDYLGESKKFQVKTDNIYCSVNVKELNLTAVGDGYPNNRYEAPTALPQMQFVIYDFRTSQQLLDVFFTIHNYDKVSYLPSTSDEIMRMLRP